MKIIFLDIDGVLNNYKNGNIPPNWTHFGNPVILKMMEQLNKDNIDNLLKIDKECEVNYVITSAWRLKYSLTEFKNLFQELKIKGQIIDYTPTLGGDSRADEINLWLDNHPEIVDFAILDDCYFIPLYPEYKLLQNNFFKVNKMKGLTDKESFNIIEHFKNKGN